jgi:hypothetical protein
MNNLGESLYVPPAPAISVPVFHNPFEELRTPLSRRFDSQSLLETNGTRLDRHHSVYSMLAAVQERQR